jgi:hypothetical protein
VSPTIFRYKQFKFFFFSREEERMHVHVLCPDGEAKFWLDPTIELARSHNLKAKTVKEIEKIIEERSDEIRKAWKKHFGS